MNTKQGTFYMFTGLAGVGKTEFGTRFYNYLKSKRNDVILFDGDVMRSTYYSGLGYTREERILSALNCAQVSKALLEQGINIVYCAIELFDEVMEWRYNNFENYVEIYIETPMEILKKNNKKNLYSGEVKDVVGMDIPFDIPKHQFYKIENDFTRSPQDIVEDLIEKLREQNKLIV